MSYFMAVFVIGGFVGFCLGVLLIGIFSGRCSRCDDLERECVILMERNEELVSKLQTREVI